jgi:L-threonylcarbamoyladenylate synthase
MPNVERAGPPAQAAFERCIAAGGVAVFPSDTVYGLACDPESSAAVERMYALKGRPPGKPSAVMFFDAALAVAALPEVGERTRELMARLLPGGVTLVLPNPRGRYPLAGGEALGLRVPDVPLLRGVGRPVLQSSANAAGAPDARRLEDVPEAIREGADLVIDAGELPGTPSTVIDLRTYEATLDWTIIRDGAVSARTIAEAARAPSTRAPGQSS